MPSWNTSGWDSGMRVLGKNDSFLRLQEPFVFGNSRHVTPPPPAGNTYYVDNTGGNDSNPGTQAQPYKSLVKVNSLSLSADDSVLFKCGETWSGSGANNRLYFSGLNGSSGHNITFGKYGTGANPIINRTDSYSIEFASCSYIIFDGINGTNCVRNYHIQDSHHITIQNADLTSTTVDESSINVFSSTSYASHDVMVLNCAIHNTPGWGVSSDSSDKLTISGCTISNIAGGGAVQHHGTYFTNCTNFLIQGCLISAPWNGGIKLVESGGKTCSGKINRNKIIGCGASASSGADISLDGHVAGVVTITNNLLMDNSVDSGIKVVNHVANNVVIYNNTIERHYYGISLFTGTTGWIVKNNIVLQDAAWLASSMRVCLNLDAAADVGNNTFDYNLWYFRHGAGSYDPIKDNGGTMSFATWKTKAGSPDVHGVSANPVFAADFTDLHIQTTSPAKVAGVTGLVTEDYAGTARANPPSIGAYEY